MDKQVKSSERQASRCEKIYDKGVEIEGRRGKNMCVGGKVRWDCAVGVRGGGGKRRTFCI